MIAQYLKREVLPPRGAPLVTYDDRQVNAVSTSGWEIRFADGTTITYTVVKVDLSDPESHPFLKSGGSDALRPGGACVICNKGFDHYFHRGHT